MIKTILIIILTSLSLVAYSKSDITFQYGNATFVLTDHKCTSKIVLDMVKDITLLDGSKMVWLNGKVSAPGFETRKLCYSKNPADPSQAYVFDEQGENGPITIPSESPKSQGS